MDEDLIILQIEDMDDDDIVVDKVDYEVQKEETFEVVEVNVPKSIDVEIEEAIGWTGNSSDITHGGLLDKNNPNSHTIEAITNLRKELDILGSTKDNYSAHSGFAEFRQWKDSNPKSEYRIGYFVSLINQNGSNYIDICNTQSEDVYGVTVDDSGFCGYQYSEYNILSAGSKNKAGSNEPYEKVCLLGTVMARVYSPANFDAIQVGDFVIPDEFGCAKKSENNIGFKVIMKEAAGAGENAWNKVTIALVPQNDNVARVMDALGETNKNLGNIILQLSDLSEKVDNNISISDEFEGLKDLLGDTTQKVDKKLKIVDATLKEAEQISSDALTAISKMETKHQEAIDRVDMAISNTNGSLSDISKYKDNLEVLAQYENNIIGFFSEESDDEVTIGTIAQSLDEANSNLSMIKQSSNAIQHLVCSVDIYSVGNLSPTDGLSYDGAQGALGSYEYIYVPIAKIYGESKNIEKSPIYICSSALEVENWYEFQIDSTIYYFQSNIRNHVARLEFNKTTQQLTIGGEKVNTYDVLEEGKTATALEFESEMITEFEVGYSYKWDQYGENNNEFWWVRDLSVSFDGNPPSEDYELWYTRNGIKDDNDNYTYNPGTLYRLIDGLWVAVATINDNNARTVSLINQTAESLSSTITNVAGDVSDIRQDVDSISLTVNDHKGQLSEINQTAEDIRLGVYEPSGGSSSLELLLGGLSSNAVYIDDKVVYTILDSTAVAVDGKYYSQPPEWNGERFVFNNAYIDNNGTYCFASDSTDKYYHNIDNGYEVYMINSTAIASLNTRVTDTESEVESWTRFEKGQNETMTSINQTSDEAGAGISSIVYGDFRECVEIGTDGGSTDFATNKYDKQPSWDNTNKCFVASGSAVSNGQYCLSKSDTKSYYKLVYQGNNIIGYEKYEMKSSDYASIVQKVEGGKSYVGLVAGNDSNMGSIVAQTINDRSSVLIEANKIAINGTTTFADTLNPEKTAISGNYIKTGCLTSNNYAGPVTYRMYGAKIVGSKIQTSTNISDCIYYVSKADGTRSHVGSTIPTYYYAQNIATNEMVISEIAYTNLTDVNKESYKYIVSTIDFDLIPTSITINGTQFDLNNGTIYSKNLQLDCSGNLSITGKITATSGYIGNSTSGFAINSSSICNGQTTLAGSGSNAGVYIGTDGIGLGNGKFKVDSSGNLTTQGSVTFKGTNGTALLTITGNSITFSGMDDDDGDGYSDVNVKSVLDSTYGIKAPNGTTITATTITSPNIVSGSIAGGTVAGASITGCSVVGCTLKVLGVGNASGSTSALYVYNGELLKGYMSYDNTGGGDETSATERMFIATVNNTVLKMQSASHMSLVAKDWYNATNIKVPGKIFMIANGGLNITTRPNSSTTAGGILLDGKQVATRDWVNNALGELDLNSYMTATDVAEALKDLWDVPQDGDLKDYISNYVSYAHFDKCGIRTYYENYHHRCYLDMADDKKALVVRDISGTQLGFLIFS